MTIPEKPTSRLQKYRLTPKGRTFLTREKMTIPEKPTSRLQKYRLTPKGRTFLTREKKEENE
jgi:predicted transcriptional regulator